MDRLKRHILFLCCTVVSITVSAQIPPDLDCVSHSTSPLEDYLAFNNVGGSACDTFIVWTSIGSKVGPYSPIDTIYGPGIFVDTIACDTGVNWYFLNCLGAFLPTSDTLDNQEPVTPLLSAVSVTGNDVFISWNKGNSPETWGYVVYWDNGTGVVPIDTIIGKNNLSTIHTGSDPSTRSQEYFIAVIDSCFNRGIISLLPHSTIYLQMIGVDSCAQTIDIGWSPYVNWTEGVDDYQVEVNINNGGYNVISPPLNTATIHKLTGLADGDSICVKITAWEKNGPGASASNELCFVANFVTPSTYNRLMIADVTSDASIELEIRADTNADLREFNIWRQVDADPPTLITTIPAPSDLQAPILYSDFGINPAKYFHTYDVEAIDRCSASVPSNSVLAIKLEAQRIDKIAYLRWNATDMYPVSTTQMVFHLEREVEGIWSTIETHSDTGLVHHVQDSLEKIVTTEGRYHYRAIATWTDLYGADRRMHSNIVEVRIPVKLHIPNAFMPNATNPINREFRPVIAFSELVSFKMQIFNRNGQQIFETDELTEGWNGRFNGSLAPMGVYVYNITFTDEDGFTINKKGTVTLIR
jgi:gliding motility-associated-like protein